MKHEILMLVPAGWPVNLRRAKCGLFVWNGEIHMKLKNGIIVDINGLETEIDQNEYVSIVDYKWVEDNGKR